MRPGRALLAWAAPALALALAPPAVDAAGGWDQPAKDPHVKFFYGKGCPHCEKEKPFIEWLERKYRGLAVDKREVWHSEENQQVMKDACAAVGEESNGVPITIIKDHCITGFGGDVTQKEIEDAVKKAYPDLPVNDVEDYGEAVPWHMDTDLVEAMLGLTHKDVAAFLAVPASLAPAIGLALAILPVAAARRRSALWAVTVVCAACGLALGAVLLKNHYHLRAHGHIEASLCQFGKVFDCAKVETSVYSMVPIGRGVPVAVAGFAGMGVIYVCAALAGLDAARRDLWMAAVLALSGFSVAVSVVMMALSSLVIKAYCLYCMGVYALSFVLAACSALHVRSAGAPAVATALGLLGGKGGKGRPRRASAVKGYTSKSK